MLSFPGPRQSFTTSLGPHGFCWGYIREPLVCHQRWFTTRSGSCAVTLAQSAMILGRLQKEVGWHLITDCYMRTLPSYRRSLVVGGGDSFLASVRFYGLAPMLAKPGVVAVLASIHQLYNTLKMLAKNRNCLNQKTLPPLPYYAEWLNSGLTPARQPKTALKIRDKNRA